MSMETQLRQLADDPTYLAHEVPIMQRWRDEDIYQKIRQKETREPLFRMIDGPPFVSSASLHLGHLLVAQMKDAVLRHRHMKGHPCLNRVGYDTHGLPSEQAQNKILGITTTKQVVEMGIARYNEACREMIRNFAGAWDPLYERIARLYDKRDVYTTMEFPFMESTWWVFRQLWDKGLVYRGFEVMPYSIGCATPLSNFEASNSYKTITTESIYVKFPLKGDPTTSLVAWTTTPWTLPSNLALCVHPTATYVKLIDSNGEGYIVAEDCVAESGIPFVRSEFLGTGTDLKGIEYVPPFPLSSATRTYRVVTGDFVSVRTGDAGADAGADAGIDAGIDAGTDAGITEPSVGTGVVHLAPAFGQDDLKVCLENQVLTLEEVGRYCPLDEDGRFTSRVPDYEGLVVFDANPRIVEDLRRRGLCQRVKRYRHNYPHCYRTHTPLIYRAVPGFFIRVTQLRDRILANNAKVTWVPEYVGTKRFHNWIASCRDWCVSRSRFFGTPIPVWISDDGTEMECFGSVSELCTRAGIPPLRDLHRESVDDIILLSKNGKPMRRSPLIMDCWFESGCVPMAQHHYPFENRDKVEQGAELGDFVAEGLDQTRGWFYTLMVLSTALFDKPAFRTVVCTGLILDEDGVKFAKSSNNFKNPFDLLAKYGADTLRLYLLSSPAVRAEPLYFSEEAVDKVRQRLIPYINGVKFFVDHTLNYLRQGHPRLRPRDPSSSANVTDQWIVSRVGSLAHSVDAWMTSFQVDTAVRACLDFLDDLTNWYIKFNRDRLKGLCGETEWRISLTTLLTVLVTYCRLTAPFTPYLSEHIYHHLRPLLPESDPDSVHLTGYPVGVDAGEGADVDAGVDADVDAGMGADNVELRFSRLQQFARAVRRLRSGLGHLASARIPIKKVIAVHHDETFLGDLRGFEDFIAEELNCLEFEYRNARDSVKYKVVPNNKVLGKRFRQDLPRVKEGLLRLPTDTLAQFHNKAITSVPLLVEGQLHDLGPDDFTVIPEVSLDIGPHVATLTDGGLTVAVDTTYDQGSHDLYQVRRFIVHVQSMRKGACLHPWDQIQVAIRSDDPALFALLRHAKITERLKTEVTVLPCGTASASASSSSPFEWVPSATDPRVVEVPVTITARLTDTPAQQKDENRTLSDGR